MPRPATYVLMTATITPAAGIGATQRSDPAVRLAEYLKAFEHYLSLPDEQVDGIVLLENSGHDLAVFEDSARRAGSAKRVLVLPTRPDYPANRGKGYGEFFMLDQGLARLRAQGLPGETRLWKVTGRLIVRNMARMIATAPAHFALYGDFRHVPLIGHRFGGNDWLELRLIAMTLDGYDRYLRGHYADGYVLEHAFFARLYPLLADHADIQPRFTTQPVLVGHSGHSNKSYTSLAYRLKGALRVFTRRHLQFLWL